MTGEDLKRLQDGFLATSKEILLEQGLIRPMGFIVTLHKHVEKIFEDGWGLEIVDPRTCMRDDQDDRVATLVIDLAMNWKKLYHAVLNVFPKTRGVLPELIAMAETLRVDDPYARVMRPFLKLNHLDEKDVIAATMRQICDKTDAFACIFHSEAWMRVVESTETVDEIYKNAPGGFAEDKKSVEVVLSAMETYDFTRTLAVPIRREPSDTRDGGKVLGFGKPMGGDAEERRYSKNERFANILKPLPEAS